MPSVAQLCDVLMPLRLRCFVDRTFKTQLGVYHGLRPGTQTLDISASLHIAFEKCADGKWYFDGVSILRITQCRMSNEVPSLLTGPRLRIQLLALMFLDVLMSATLGASYRLALRGY